MIPAETNRYRIFNSSQMMEFGPLNQRDFQTMCTGKQATAALPTFYPNPVDFHVAYREGGQNYLAVLRKSGEVSGSVVRTFASVASLFSLRVPATIDAGNPNTPGVLFFHFNDVGRLAVYHRSMRLPDTVNTVVVWNNELGVEAQDLRVMDTPYGPCVVAVAESGYAAGAKGLYFKFLNTAAADVAQELICDFKLGNFSFDLDRCHVSCLANGTVIIYYRVFESQNGVLYEATGFTSFMPVVDGVVGFSASRIQTQPYPVLYDYVPALQSSRGVAVHPYTGRLAVLFEDGTRRPFYGCSDGYGYLFESSLVPIESPFQSLTAKKLLKTAVVRYTELDSSVGTTFYASGYYSVGSIASTDKALYWTYAANTADGKTLKRMLLNELDVSDKEGVILPCGTFRIEAHNSGKFLLQNADRVGYDLTADPYGLLLASTFEEVIQLKQIVAYPGESGTSAFTFPATGMQGFAREFPKENSQIRFPDTNGYLSTEDVTVSFWVYLEVSVAGAVRSLVYKHNGVDGLSYAIFWDEVEKKLICKFSDSGGVQTITHVDPIPPDRWYHVTFTYSKLVGRAFLYLFAKALGSAVTDGGLFYDGEKTAILLGDSSAYADGYPSVRGRMDGLLVGGTAADHETILMSFAREVTGKTAPVYSSRVLDSADRTTGCFHFTDSLGVGYSLTVREVRFGKNDLSELMLCTFLDLYRRPRGEEPEYLATYPTPTFMNTAMGTLKHSLSGTVSNSKLSIAGVFLAGIGVLSFVVSLVGTDAEEPAMFLCKGTLFPTSPGGGPVFWDKVAVVNLNNFRVNYGLTMITPGIVVMSLNDDGDKVFFIRATDYGDDAFTTAPWLSVDSLVPALEDTNNAVDLSGVGQSRRLCGIVHRSTTENMGLESANQYQIQLVYGLSAVDPDPEGEPAVLGESLISTASVIISYESLNTETVVMLTDPISLDYHGVGGIGPFHPVAVLGAEAGEEAKDVFYLGYEGVSRLSTAGEHVSDGEANLCLYRAPADGFTHVEKVINVPFVSTESGNYLKHAHAARYVLEDRTYITVLRAYGWNEDGFKTNHYKMPELEDLNYPIPEPAALYMAVLTNYKLQVPTWTDISVDQPRFSSIGPGTQTVVETKLFDLSYKTKLSRVGLAAKYYTLTPNTMFFRNHSVFGASSLGIVRTFLGDSTLHAGFFGAGLNTGHNVVASESLGEIGVGESQVWPVAALEHEGLYHYYHLVFQAAGFTQLMDAYGPITGFSSTVAAAWNSPILLPTQCFEHCRIVVHAGKIYLYFLLTSAQSTSVFCRQLSPGETVAGSAVPVLSLPFKVSGRFYVQSAEHVTLYFGNTDAVPKAGTYAFVHKPATNELFKPLTLFQAGVVPYPRCNPIVEFTSNNVRFMAMYLESVQSLVYSGGFPGERGDRFKLEKDTGLTHHLCLAYNHGMAMYDLKEVPATQLVPLMADRNPLEAVINDVGVIPCGLVQKGPLSFEVMFALFEKNDSDTQPFKTAVIGQVKTSRFDRGLALADPQEAEPVVFGSSAPRLLRYRLTSAELSLRMPVVLDSEVLLPIGNAYSQNDAVALSDLNSALGTLEGTTPIQPIWNHVHGAKVITTDNDRTMSAFLMWEDLG